MGYFYSKTAFSGMDMLLFISAVRRWMPIGQISGAVCKMYVRRRVNSKRLCTQEGRPIIISGVLLVLVYFQIGAIGGMFVPKRSIAASCSYKGKLSREIGWRHTHNTHILTRSFGVYTVRVGLPHCVRSSILYRGMNTFRYYAAAVSLWLKCTTIFKSVPHAWLRPY